MKIKTKSVVCISALLILSQLGSVNAASSNVITPNQVVDASKTHDVGTQIDNMENSQKRIRASYTPTGGLGGGTWGATYAMSIAPLLLGAQQKADDYTTANSHMNSEFTYYSNAYSYWLLSQTAQYKTENLTQAQHELDVTNQKLKQGIASNTDQLQAQISVNNAQADLDKANLAKQVEMYQINQAMDVTTDAPLDIENVDLTFLSPDDLNVEHNLSYLYQTHQSLVALNQLLAANEKAQSIAAGQTDINVPIKNLVDFYGKEIEETQLKIKQQRQRIEMATRSYIEQAKTLENTIKLDQDNIANMKKVYENYSNLYEVGMSTFNDLESIRLKLLATNLQLASDQKDYLVLKQKYRLFKNGAFFTN